MTDINVPSPASHLSSLAKAAGSSWFSTSHAELVVSIAALVVTIVVSILTIRHARRNTSAAADSAKAAEDSAASARASAKAAEDSAKTAKASLGIERDREYDRTRPKLRAVSRRNLVTRAQLTHG